MDVPPINAWVRAVRGEGISTPKLGLVLVTQFQTKKAYYLEALTANAFQFVVKVHDGVLV